MKTDKTGLSRVYADVIEDSLILFRMKSDTSDVVDTESGKGISISSIKPDDELYGGRFIKNSVEVDLSTIPVKLRPSASGVPV